MNGAEGPIRAAVVIGVDRTGGLAPLQSAALGARQAADWLRSEGYEVALLTDADGPVEYGAIEDAIFRFTALPTRYEMLVVYFTGHGLLHGRSDAWLLSGAPQRTGEAFNLDGAVQLAKYCGVPNVVFVSDACRAAPPISAGRASIRRSGFRFTARSRQRPPRSTAFARRPRGRPPSRAISTA